MKRLSLSFAVAVLLATAVMSCGDDATLVDPADLTDPSMGKYDGPQDENAQRITLLLQVLYPDGGLETAAMNRWSNIQTKMARGQLVEAREQMADLVAHAQGLAEEERLDAPDFEEDPTLPESVEDAVGELTTRLIVFVELPLFGEPGEIPEEMPEDIGVGEIDPETGGTVTTQNNWAAVIAEPEAVEEPTIVVIELLDEETCEGAGDLIQAAGCWNINQIPPDGSGGEPPTDDELFTVEVCVADNPTMTDEEWDLLLLHKKDESGVVTALPWAEPTTVDCEGFGEETPEPPVGLSPVASVLKSVGTRVAGLLLPEPLKASPWDVRRPPRGLGGLTGTFSEFFGAVPEGAKDDLIAWWTADGNYLNMYGGNHGTPVGPVTFDPGVSDQAWSFDGTGGVVGVDPAPVIDDLQDITVSAWVRMNDSGRENKIQRFVTLGGEKAVLRQDGLNYPSQLHYYMSIGGALHHIRVNNALSTGCFDHLVGTYDGSTMRAYLNGEEVGNLQVAGSVDPGGGVEFSFQSPQAPNGDEDPQGEALDGQLDEVMIFKRALDITEISEIHQAGGPAKCQLASAAHSVFDVADPNILVGESTLLTLQAKDGGGNDIGGGGASVTFASVDGALTSQVEIGPVTDIGDGTYSADVTGLASGLSLTIKATVDGEEVTTGDVVMTVDPVALTSEQAEALIGGSYLDWWEANHDYYGVASMLSVAADEHTSSWQNAGMMHASTEPRQPWDNTADFPYAYATQSTWLNLYRSLLSNRAALDAIGQGLLIGEGGADTPRAVAFAKFVQGLSLGTLALVYDQAFILDETTDLATASLAPYGQVMAAALAKLDEAILAAGTNTFTTDPGWINGAPLTRAELVQLCHAYKARFMAQVPRTLQDRLTVNWAQVVAEIDAGITSDFSVTGDWDIWWDVLKSYASGGSGTSTSWAVWGRLDVRYLGAADTIGAYQAWLDLPVADRNEILIETPDRRITGATPETDGLYVKYIGPSGFRSDRGTYHFSYYGDKRYDALVDNDQIGPMIEMSTTEMDYLLAEAMYRLGNQAAAVAVVNATRAAAQLPAITVNGPSGTACVPRKEDGTCGDFWDALKYEKRLEVFHTGMGIAFFDDRGWGDLVDDTFLHLPVPGQELEILGLPYYTFGGPAPSDVVAAQGPLATPSAEALTSYWQSLPSRLSALEEEIRGGGRNIIRR